MIAFTSTFLPKLLYRYAVSPDNSLNGYTNFSLAWSPPNTTSKPCRYVIRGALDSMCAGGGAMALSLVDRFMGWLVGMCYGSKGSSPDLTFSLVDKFIWEGWLVS